MTYDDAPADMLKITVEDEGGQVWTTRTARHRKLLQHGEGYQICGKVRNPVNGSLYKLSIMLYNVENIEAPTRLVRKQRLKSLKKRSEYY